MVDVLTLNVLSKLTVFVYISQISNHSQLQLFCERQFSYGPYKLKVFEQTTRFDNFCKQAPLRWAILHLYILLWATFVCNIVIDKMFLHSYKTFGCNIVNYIFCVRYYYEVMIFEKHFEGWGTLLE